MTSMIHFTVIKAVVPEPDAPVSSMMEALLSAGIDSADVKSAILLDSVYQCHLGFNLITFKQISGHKLHDATCVSLLVEELVLDPATQYFPLARLYSVFKYIEKHRRTPAANPAPASAWMSKQEKYAQHAALFDKHRIVDVMMEHIEPLASSFVLGLPLATVREMKADFLAAHPRIE